MELKKEYAAGIAAFVILAVAAVAVTSLPDSESNAKSNVSWEEVELEDVRTGEKFTVSEFERPVLVENFAVWCTICLRQQKEIEKLHEDVGDDVVSVSINTDPGEDREKVLQHVNRHGFNWRYAVSPPEMTRSLLDEYGPSIVNAPSAPKILVCGNDTRRLPNGVMPASKLKEEIEKGC